MAAIIVKNVKRRPRQHRCQARAKVGVGISIVDTHDIAYWSQWRLAIHEVCARFEEISQEEADKRCTEQLDRDSIARQQACNQALSREVRHLETQLGKHTSMNAKLEAALCDNAEALVKAESARAAAAAAVSRLQVRGHFLFATFDIQQIICQRFPSRHVSSNQPADIHVSREHTVDVYPRVTADVVACR